MRIDVFVKHQLQASSRFEKNWSGGLPRWEMTRTTFDRDVRRRVPELENLYRKHSLWLGLDSWKTMLASAEATEKNCKRVFTEFAELWAKANPVLRDNGVLERAVWLAPLNEVLWHGARAPVVSNVFREKVREGQTDLEKNASSTRSTAALTTTWPARLRPRSGATPSRYVIRPSARRLMPID